MSSAPSLEEQKGCTKLSNNSPNQLKHVLYRCLCIVLSHTHTHLTALYPGLPRWAGTRKVKPNLEFTEARDSEWQWNPLAIHKSAPRSRQITTPAPHHSVLYRPDALPAAQPTASKHWRHVLCFQQEIKHQTRCAISISKALTAGLRETFSRRVWFTAWVAAAAMFTSYPWQLMTSRSVRRQYSTKLPVDVGLAIFPRESEGSVWMQANEWPRCSRWSLLYCKPSADSWRHGTSRGDACVTSQAWRHANDVSVCDDTSVADASLCA